MSDETVASDESEFWVQRHDLTPEPITEAALEERAVGRDRHLVLLASLADDDVASEFRPVLDRLGAYDCFVPIEERFLHVTVKVFGNVVAEPTGKAEFSGRAERELVDSLKGAVERFGTFQVSFPRINLFPAAVYAEVNDDGQFGELNRRVCALPEVPVWDRDLDGFIPHVSLGHFIQRNGYEELVAALEAKRELDVSATAIEALQFVALDLSEGRFPAFETIATYSLC